MKESDSNYLYIITAVIIVLSLWLLFQIFHKKRNVKKNNRMILIDTPNGLIDMPVNYISNEISKIRDNLNSQYSCLGDNMLMKDPELLYNVQQSISGLHAYIIKNPSNDITLDRMEQRNAILDRIVFDGDSEEFAPTEITDNQMDIEEECPMPIVIKKLIRYIDGVIDMLDNDLCDCGRINFIHLNNVVKCLDKHIDSLGGVYEKTEMHLVREPRKLNTADRYVSETSIPMNESCDGVQRQSVRPEEIARLSNLSKVTTSQLMNNNASYDEIMGRATMGDISFEGLVEQDIANFKTPGHLIGQITDVSDHYTVNFNSCLGKVIPDEHFIKECGVYDINLRRAINGDASGIIAGLENTMHK